MTWTLLHEFCTRNEINDVRKRCQTNPEEILLCDDHLSSPLHLACLSDPSNSILESILYTNPVAISLQDAHGDTPIHVALKNTDTKIEAIRVMVKSYPPVLEISNKEGLKPIHAACRHCSSRTDIIDFLATENTSVLMTHIKIGSLMSTSKTRGKSKHHFIADFSLRSAKSYSDIRFNEQMSETRDGAYPLHIALDHAAPLDVIRILVLKAPSVLHMKNKFGKVPLEVAEERQYSKDVINFLIKESERLIKH